MRVLRSPLEQVEPPQQHAILACTLLLGPTQSRGVPKILVHMPVEHPVSGPRLSVVGARIPCMATVFDDLTSHPVAAAVAAAETDLDQVAGFGAASMSRTEIADTLAALHRLRAKVAALELGILPTAETHEVGTDAGATDTAAWWANTTRQTKRDTNRRVALAALLDVDHETVRDAMAAGQVSEEQAGVIVRGLEAIPVEHRRDAERHLIELAAEHDPVALRRLAARILEVVAPDIAEEHERKALERQEALAEEACRFTIADDGHGLCHGRFTLPSPVGAMLKQSILAMNAPKHRRHSGTPKGLGHAFCE